MDFNRRGYITWLLNNLAGLASLGIMHPKGTVSKLLPKNYMVRHLSVGRFILSMLVVYHGALGFDSRVGNISKGIFFNGFFYR